MVFYGISMVIGGINIFFLPSIKKYTERRLDEVEGKLPEEMGEHENTENLKAENTDIYKSYTSIADLS